MPVTELFHQVCHPGKDVIGAHSAEEDCWCHPVMVIEDLGAIIFKHNCELGHDPHTPILLRVRVPE